MLPHNNYHGIEVMWDLTIFISFKWISWLGCIELHKAHITEEYVYECVFKDTVMIFFYQMTREIECEKHKDGQFHLHVTSLTLLLKFADIAGVWTLFSCNPMIIYFPDKIWNLVSHFNQTNSRYNRCLIFYRENIWSSDHKWRGTGLVKVESTCSCNDNNSKETDTLARTSLQQCGVFLCLFSKPARHNDIFSPIDKS